MAVIVEFSLDSEAFPFGQSTAGDPEVRVQLERVVPLEQDRIPFVRATGSDLGQFERTLRESDIEPGERVERCEWAVWHLSTALETEDVDEKDYHVSLARRLLVEDASRRRKGRDPREYPEVVTP